MVRAQNSLGPRDNTRSKHAPSRWSRRVPPFKPEVTREATARHTLRCRYTNLDDRNPTLRQTVASFRSLALPTLLLLFSCSANPYISPPFLRPPNNPHHSV